MNLKNSKKSQSTTHSDAKEGFFHRILKSQRSKDAIIVAIISVIGTIIVAFISQGIFTPAINGYLYPKVPIIQKNFVLTTYTVHADCVDFQQSDEYYIQISTDGTPVDLYIFNESSFDQYSKHIKSNPNEMEQDIIKGNFPFTPLIPGQYFIVVDNEVGNIFPEYANKTVTVNL